MTHLSSNSTLFFKFFVPVFWLVFFGAFFISLFITDAEYIGDIPIFMARVLTLGFLAIGGLVFYLYIFPLKRIEASPEHWIVTDYFKNYRYTYDSIEKITERDWFFFHTHTIFLKEAGSFGRKINFIGSRKRLKKFREANPSTL